MVVRRTQWLVVIGVATISAVIHIAISYQGWVTGLVPSWDLAIFSQLAKAYANFSAPIVPVKGINFNLLGDHFHPILVLLGPIWALWPSPLALLVAQGLLFSLSTVPITRYVTQNYGPLLGVIIGLSYGLSWGLQSATVSQFHEIAFAVVMLSFGLIAYLEQRFSSATIWLSLLVFVKEDFGITVAMFGLVVWLMYPQLKKLAIFLAIWGFGWTGIATMVILPALNPKQHYDYTENLSGMGAAFQFPGTYIMLAMLVATAGVFGFGSRIAWLLVPTLTWRLLGNVGYYWGWDWHYSATLMPIAFVALLDAINRYYFLSSSASSSDPTAEPKNDLKKLSWLGWIAIAITLAVTLSFGSNQPALRLISEHRWDMSHKEAMTAAMETVSENDTVLTDLSLLAYLVPDHEVYWLGSSHPTPDVVIRDKAANNVWDDEAKKDLADWASKKYQANYKIILTNRDFVVATRIS